MDLELITKFMIDSEWSDSLQSINKLLPVLNSVRLSKTYTFPIAFSWEWGVYTIIRGWFALLKSQKKTGLLVFKQPDGSFPNTQNRIFCRMPLLNPMEQKELKCMRLKVEINHNLNRAQIKWFSCFFIVNKGKVECQSHGGYSWEIIIKNMQRGIRGNIL